MILVTVWIKTLNDETFEKQYSKDHLFHAPKKKKHSKLFFKIT